MNVKSCAVLSMLFLSSCSSAIPGRMEATATAPPPPNFRAMVLRDKHNIWKDADSIKNASISDPQRGQDLWSVCVRTNAKNSFGAYAGTSDTIVMIYDNGRIVTSPSDYGPCQQNFKPFKELEGK